MTHTFTSTVVVTVGGGHVGAHVEGHYHGSNRPTRLRMSHGVSGGEWITWEKREDRVRFRVCVQW